MLAEIGGHGNTDLLEIGCAHGSLGLDARFAQCGQQDSDQGDDDRHHDEKFDERKRPPPAQSDPSLFGAMLRKPGAIIDERRRIGDIAKKSF